MRKKIVAGNWKMNLTAQEIPTLVQGINQKVKDNNWQGEDRQVLFFPATIFVDRVSQISEEILVGTQDLSEHESGAFTGEISAKMTKSLSLEWTLLGHSERRIYHSETNEQLNKKIHTALSHHLKVIYCIGETLEEREAGKHWEIIADQLKIALANVTTDQMKQIVIAYEPVWAIGTGLTATSDQAQEAHQFIREQLEKRFDKNTAADTSILYGGSCKPSNAKELFSKPDVDGGLIGGAALKVEDFCGIIEAIQ